jgi:MFS superfamily sulfate permease-like transporter
MMARLKNRFLDFSSDLFSGGVVFLVALPLCLGIALASGAPPQSGLLAGIIGGIVVAMLSGSHSSVSGPAAGLTGVVAAQIAALGGFEAFLAALALAGLLQIIMGLARLGFIASFFPSSVIKGLLAAIGIILILKQLPHLFGWDIDADGEMSFWQQDQENSFSELINTFSHIHLGATLIGLLSLFVLIIWDKIPFLKKSRFPSSLFLVLGAVLLSFILSSIHEVLSIAPEHRVQVPVAETFSAFLGFFTIPDWSAFLSPAVYSAAFTLALVASLESLLNLEAVDKIDPRKRFSPPNRELIAQGFGNMILGLIGGLPVSSVLVRSSVNINAGAKTKVSAIVHGILLFFCVILLPYYVNLIPLSCLAAILIFTGSKLLNPSLIRQMWQAGYNQFLPFAITIIAIVLTDLLTGVVIGLLTSLIFILHSNLKRPLNMSREKHIFGDFFRISFANQVSFLNRAALKRAFDELPSKSQILLDGRASNYIDADIIDLIKDFKEEDARAREIKVSLRGFHERFGLKNEIYFADHATHELQNELKPEQVLTILREGNERTQNGKRLERDLSRQILATSNGQFPLGVVLSCMDSRAPAELIFDLGIGDIFSVRMAGHVLSERVLGSLEFACVVAGAKLIMVMGHSRCGAINAAIDFLHSDVSISQKTKCTHLASVVGDIQKLIRENFEGTPPSKEDPVREQFEKTLGRIHVQNCMKNIIKESKSLETLVVQGQVALVGSLYDVSTGKVEFIDFINDQDHAKNAQPIGPTHEKNLQMIAY